MNESCVHIKSLLAGSIFFSIAWETGLAQGMNWKRTGEFVIITRTFFHIAYVFPLFISQVRHIFKRITFYYIPLVLDK